MLRQFRVREYSDIFEYFPNNLYKDIKKDCLDTFNRYEWIGIPFLEDLFHPIAGIAQLLLGMITIPFAIGKSIYDRSLYPCISSLCRIIRGIMQLITTPFLPFKIIIRFILMNYQKKLPVETMLSTWHEGMIKWTVPRIRDTLTLFEIEYDEILKSSPRKEEDTLAVSETKMQCSNMYVLIQLKNRYQEEGKKCFVRDENGDWCLVPSIASPMSDDEISGYIFGLIRRYRFLMYVGHPSLLKDTDDFIREGDSVADYFYFLLDHEVKKGKFLSVSRYQIYHAQAFLDYFYPRISLKELSNMTGVPLEISEIIAAYSPEKCKNNFQVTDMKYKEKEIHEFCPYSPWGKMSM
ncbi:MAG: hypothetical protein K0R24_111 [Gammaproteobacteria bacterium]|jgi:hypothetical protein|nr:hypothetical protein [Gammaproteobacteria bacterium]